MLIINQPTCEQDLRLIHGQGSFVAVSFGLWSIVPGHDEFELLGVDEAVAVPVEDLERLPDLSSLQNDKEQCKGQMNVLFLCERVSWGQKLLRLKSASGSSDSAIYPLLRSLL